MHGIQLKRGPACRAARHSLRSSDRRPRNRQLGLAPRLQRRSWRQRGNLARPIRTRPTIHSIRTNVSRSSLADGRVYVNAREHQGSDPATRTVAYSSDGGETFDAPFVAEPNITSPVVQNSLDPVCGDRPGATITTCWFTAARGIRKERRDLTILVSLDEGKTWTQKTVIHRRSGRVLRSGEAKRPAVRRALRSGPTALRRDSVCRVGLDDLKPRK